MQVTFSPSSVYPLSCECSACFVGASDLVFYAQFLIPFPYFLEDIHSFNTYYIISVQAFSRCPLPISCSTFNSDGSIFAYAVSQLGKLWMSRYLYELRFPPTYTVFLIS